MTIRTRIQSFKGQKKIRTKIQSLGGQNVARIRAGASPRAATQRMRELRARSPITGQIGHPISFPRPKLGQQMVIPKPFGGKILFKAQDIARRIRAKIPFPKLR